MKADLDIDFVAHLGYLRNVDLLQKGVYCVQISLKCGAQSNNIPPVGMFSSSSTLDSFVDDLRVIIYLL
jgi:hypothetical protein